MDPYVFLFIIGLLIQLFLWVSVFIVTMIPKRIEAIRFKEHILSRRIHSIVFQHGTMFVFIIIWLFASIIRGFDTITSYGFIGLIALVIGKQILSAIRNTSGRYKRTIYFGKEDVSEEIDQFNKKHSNIEITKSIANSPLQARITADNPTQLQFAIQLICANNQLMEDLNQQQFKRKYVLYTISLILSGVYILVFFSLYILGLILEYTM